MSWLENLQDARKAKEAKEGRKISNEWIAERSGVPKSTVDRTFKGKNSPSIATLHPICAALDTTLDEILNGTRTVISAYDVPELQCKIDELNTILAELTVKCDTLTAENDELKEQVCYHKSENNILKIKLEMSEKLLEVHDFYMKKHQ